MLLPPSSRRGRKPMGDAPDRRIARVPLADTYGADGRTRHRATDTAGRRVPRLASAGGPDRLCARTTGAAFCRRWP